MEAVHIRGSYLTTSPSLFRVRLGFLNDSPLCRVTTPRRYKSSRCAFFFSVFAWAQAIRGRPTSWCYWSDLGWCYHTEGKQAAALKAYTRAEELLEQEREGLGADGSVVAVATVDPTGVRGGTETAARVRIKTQVEMVEDVLCLSSSSWLRKHTA